MLMTTSKCLKYLPVFAQTLFFYMATLSPCPRFMSGKEVKKKKHLFGLRIRFPPVPPNCDEPTSRVMEKASHEITIKGCKSTKALSAIRLDMKRVDALKLKVPTGYCVNLILYRTH